MKHNIIKYMAAACLLATVSSCKPDMDLNNPSEVSTNTYYQKISQLHKCCHLGFSWFQVPGDNIPLTFCFTSVRP